MEPIGIVQDVPASERVKAFHLRKPSDENSYHYSESGPIDKMPLSWNDSWTGKQALSP